MERINNSDYLAPGRTSPEDRILFACTRQQFLETHQQTLVDICRSEQVNWDVVFATAKLHGVAPLIYANLRQASAQGLDIPPDVMKRFRLSLMQNTLTKEKRAKNLVRAVSFFSKRSIDVMLIKGAALDVLVYEEALYTAQSDVDIIISVKRTEITDQEFNEFMAYFHGSGIEYDYFEHHDVCMNGVLPINFQTIWADASELKLGDQQVFVMAPEDMLISLCINSCRKRFFRLKALCDIAETVNKYQHLEWPVLVEKARAYHCSPIVYTALLITTLTLGCEIPDAVLDELQVSPGRTKLINFLSRRMSPSAFSSLYSGKLEILGRSINPSLLLPYVTFSWDQTWRKITFALLFSEAGTRRTRHSLLGLLKLH